MIDVFVPGRPAPQGSKTYVGNGIMLESCKAVKPWRESIRCALLTDQGQPIERFGGAVVFDLMFVLPRPKSTPKRKTPLAVKKPDLDKLCRAVFDAVKSAGVTADDSCVTFLMATKRLAELDETPGLYLRVKGKVPR
jgi:crossover junction endodeoxyribonuclease RusA